VLAVSHSGDSDSTGAITGNILGAMLGTVVIPQRWLEPLELRDVIEAVLQLCGRARSGILIWRMTGFGSGILDTKVLNPPSAPEAFKSPGSPSFQSIGLPIPDNPNGQ